MTEQHAKRGRLAGAAAGAAVLAAAAAAGFVYWEGTVFDARFADFAKRLSEEGARAGLTIAAEETDRSFAGRGLSLSVASPGVKLRWTGRAEFGFGSKAVLRFDPDKEAAEALRAEGIEGLGDELTVTADATGREIRYDWKLKPFGLKGEDGLHCSVGAVTLKGGADFASAALHWDGMRCEAEGEELSIASADADYRAKNEGETFALDLRSSEMIYRSSETSVEMTELTFAASGGPAKQTAEKADRSKADKTAPAEKQPKIFDFGYGLTVTSLKLDGETVLDKGSLQLRLLNVEEELAAGVAAESAAGEGFSALARLEDAFMNRGLVLELDEALLARNGGRAELTGRLARTAERFGALALSIDPKAAAGLPDIESELKLYRDEGLLKENDGRLTSHIEIREDGVVANGKPL
ncbi:MAG: hypothetical protein J6K46_06155 [Sutterella sp.]|nr:hypothetical protein [Sutterella sp.]